MTVFRPWLEEGAPPQIEKMLRAARCERPSDRALRRALVAAAAGATSGAAAGAAGAGAKTALFTLALKWTGIGMTGAGLLAGGAMALHAVRGKDSVVATVGSVRPRTDQREAREARPIVSPPGSQGVTDSAPPASALVQHSASLPLPSAVPTGEVPASLLAEEIQLVDQARRDLARGDPAGALAALAQYESRFAERSLGPEVLYLRMEAYLRLGSEQSAQEVARQMIRLYPKSPHLGRAEQLLAREQKPTPTAGTTKSDQPEACLGMERASTEVRP